MPPFMRQRRRPTHRRLEVVWEGFSEFFFFFSSRRRHTRFKCDWSSDVCSSDLRRAIRVLDLADPLALGRKIERLLAHHNALRRGLALKEIGVDAVREYLESVAPRVLPYVDSVWSLLDQKRREGKRILFEGAQGALLDIDHGTYPFVTSSN